MWKLQPKIFQDFLEEKKLFYKVSLQKKNTGRIFIEFSKTSVFLVEIDCKNFQISEKIDLQVVQKKVLLLF